MTPYAVVRWRWLDNQRPPAKYFLGGLLGASSVLAATFIPAEIGFALFSAMLVTGQLICANAMDHFALLGLEKQHFGWLRFLSLALCIAGAGLNIAERVNADNAHWYLIVGLSAVSAFSGVCLVFQTALNTKLAKQMTAPEGGPLHAALISFSIGAGVLIVASLSIVASKHEDLSGIWHLRDTVWWMFMGGPIGAVFVSVSILLAPRLGVALWYVLVVAGQLAMSLLFDDQGFYGFQRQKATPIRIAGVSLVLLGAALLKLDRLAKSKKTTSTTVEPLHELTHRVVIRMDTIEWPGID